MDAKTRIATTLLSVALAFGLFLQQSTSAQATRGFVAIGGNTTQPGPSPNSNCKKIRGNGIQVFDPLTGVVSGPVLNSGILDGTLEDVINFGAGFIFTPDPTVISYTTNLTITTMHGQLKANPVTTQSVVTGIGAEWGTVDSEASTGKFAGVTGTILVSFKPVGDPALGPYETEIIADICFAP